MMQQRSQRTQRGFTLLELLLVIAVMGILVAILMPVIGKVRRSAIERKAQAQKAALKTAITTYFAHHKEWPISENDSSRDLTYGGNGNERRVAAILTRLETPGDDLPPLIQRDDYREENDEIINPSTGAPLQITFDLDYNGVITNRSNNAVMCPVLVE